MDYPELTIIGLMSGTSLDGLDIAACKFGRKGQNWSYEILAADTIEYDLEKRNKLRGLMEATALELTQEHFNFGYFLGDSVSGFLQNNKIKVDYVASHGHTIFHRPEFGFTLQIGNGACIAARCKLPTISDFRSLDVALNGQGAPLVPIGDKLLFSEYSHCLNLGGIANISFDDEAGKRLAFDICPVNLVMNKLAQQKGLEYDKDGLLARAGKFHEGLYAKLEKLEFYEKAGPKSIGKEWVDEAVLPLIESFDISVEDALHTFSCHIAERISAVVNKKSATDKILITGGGAFNKFLIEQISRKCSVEVVVPAPEIVMFKEALIFAFLGYLRVLGVNNSLASVTGASVDSCGGAIFSI